MLLHPPPPATFPRPTPNPRYELIDVGSLGGLVTTAQHVNDFGEVIGTANTPDNLSMHAYLWREGQLEDLGTLGGNSSQGVNINNRGQAAGNNFNFSSNNGMSAFVYAKGEAQILPFDIAYAVNLRNQVVGQLTLPDPDPRGSQNSWVAVLYENGVLTQLGIFPGGSFSSAYDINNRGEIVGVSAIAGFQGSPAYVYRDGKMIDLGTLGGSNSGATAINAWGHITGGAALEDGHTHAFGGPGLRNRAVDAEGLPKRCVSIGRDRLEVTQPVNARRGAAWTLQQLCEVVGYGDRYQFLIHDRDCIFASKLEESIRALGIRVLKSRPHMS